MAGAGERLRHGLRMAFGELSWRPPGWLSRAAIASRGRIRNWRAFVRENPRRAAAYGATLVVVLGAAFGLWRWYETRPRPIAVGFSVTAPAVTCYACDPPGRPHPLLVRFAEAVAPLEHVGRPLDPGQRGVSMQPQLAGQWSWDDDRVLRFQPAQDWPIGTRFQVTFARKGFAAGHVRLTDDGFEFRSAAFVAQIAGTEFHQDPLVAGNKKAVATIAFTHSVDPASFESRVRLRMFSRVNDATEREIAAPAHSVVYDKLKLNAYVHSAELEVPAKAGRLELAIQPGVSAARGGNQTDAALTTSIDVPGLNSLKIADVSLDIVRDERNEPDQVLLLRTSFSVLERDVPPRVHAWLLPLRHPDPKVQQRHRSSRPFACSEQNFRPEVLNAQARLELTQIPGEREHYDLHSLRYKADPGRYVYVKVDAGLQSFGGYRLGESVERIVRVPEFPRELGILHEGSLLAMSGEKKVTLFARNLPAIRIEVGRLLPRQLQHLVSQTSGDFGTPQFNW